MGETATESPTTMKRKHSKQEKKERQMSVDEGEASEVEASPKKKQKVRHNSATVQGGDGSPTSKVRHGSGIEDDKERQKNDKGKKKRNRRKRKEGALEKSSEDGKQGEKDEEPEEGTSEAKKKEGFTRIEKVDELQRKKVERVLPYWLTNPTFLSQDLSDSSEPIQENTCLEQDLKERLQENKIKYLFPVQRAVIPKVLEEAAVRMYRPHDICVSSPTGSGKTLAYVLPIVQCLRSRLVCRVSALVVLPVQSLALQVYNVFKTYAENTKLNIGLISGQNSLANEQKALIWKGATGWHSRVDIVVCTPGRLLDHLRNTEGFTLQHLKFLVLDEADRLVDDESLDWLPAIYSSIKAGDRVLIPARLASRSFPPQKLLFSATLSSNPEKLQQLQLFQPLLFSVGTTDGNDKATTESTVNAYAVPSGLQEYLVRIDAALKPLALHHLIEHKQWKRVLCFTNSRESAHRLCELMVNMGLDAKDFSAKMHSGIKRKLLKEFLAGNIRVLISTDAMARGMDINKVQVVINYDPPLTAKTYIHRIGRTARAGKKGTAVTLVSKSNLKNVTQRLRKVGRGRVEELQVEEDSLKPMEAQYKEALQKLKEIVEEEELMQKKLRKRTLTKKGLLLRQRKKLQTAKAKHKLKSKH